jgi:hypothetical protein
MRRIGTPCGYPDNRLVSRLQPLAVRRNTRKPWLLISLAAIASAVAWLLTPTDNAAAPVAQPASGVAPAAAIERSGVALSMELPKRQLIGRARNDPFGPRSWAPPPPTPRLEREDPAPPPSAPPLPYRFAGTVRYGGVLKVVLAVGDRIYEAKVGELLDGLYRVRAVSSDAVTLVYTPLGIEQRVSYASGASARADVPQPGAPNPPQQMAVEHQPLPVTHQAQRALSPFPPGSPLATR